MTAAPAPVAKPPAPRPLSLAKAHAVAQAAVLVAADLPGYTASNAGTPAEAEALFDRCAGVKATPYLVRNFGREFLTKDYTQISSSADIARTSAQAKADLTLATSARGQHCYSALIAAAAKKAGLPISTPTFHVFTPRVPIADNSIGYVVTWTYTRHGRSQTISYLELMSQVGQTEISLGVRPGGTRVTVTDAALLLTSLVARVDDART